MHTLDTFLRYFAQIVLHIKLWDYEIKKKGKELKGKMGFVCVNFLPAQVHTNIRVWQKLYY